MTSRKRRRSPFLNRRFGAAVKEFGIAMIKTGSLQHRGDKGKAREEALRKFFRERLPKRYAVAEGEVVDIFGRTSPQMDLLFYDQDVDFALNSDTTSILPAEALLATVEVKSSINATEISKIVGAAEELRKLQPFGKPLGGKDVGSGLLRTPRYFHCVFAYDTDLSRKDWLNSEGSRFVNSCRGKHVVDVVYVLGRGLLNMQRKMGRLEDEEGGAITEFYFSILNFVQREANRRRATPFERYVKPAPNAWVSFSR